MYWRVERVLGLLEHLDERLEIEILHRRHNGQTTNELRDQPESNQILRHHLGKDLGIRPFIERTYLGAEADGVLANTLADDLFQAGERSTADEQHVGGVDLQELLMRVLPATLRWHRGDRAFEDLEQRLLDPLTGNIAGDRRILRLAGDLVDLVEVDDPGLRSLDVEVGRLDQLEQDILDVLTDVAGLGQGGGIGDSKGNIETTSQRLGKQSLTDTGRSDHEDVGLLQLDILVFGLLPGAHPLVVVVNGYGENPLGLVLPDNVTIEELEDLVGLGQLGEAHLFGVGKLLLDDLIAQLDAFVTDVDTWTGDEFAHLLLRLAAEAAFEEFAAFVLRQVVLSSLPVDCL